MTEERTKRKLSGILSADAVGYSHLIERDEKSTIRTLADSKELMANLIQQYRGRVVDAPGDNLLAEFGSVVDATECAVKIQQELKSKNADLPDNRGMQFRIGVNLGDVVEEADRIYGAGVNIAARLEGLAEPGGICISRTAYDHVKNKLEVGYEYLGEHTVKNIAEPVRVYRVLMEPEAAGKVIGEKRFLGRFSRKTAISAIVALVIIAGGLIGWNIYLQQSKKVEPASLEKMAFPLPDKPSIAVLPFANMSGDPTQEYISDGFTDTIITQLYKVPNMFVIARASSSIYKGKNVKVQQVAEELGVRNVLEGSVQRSENRIRINAQLIDALTGNHLWAELYDRELKDIFAVQDEITRKIVTELAVKISWGEIARAWAHATENYEALDRYYQADKYLTRFEKESNIQARKLLKKAIELDPKFSRAIAFLGLTHMIDVLFGWAKDPLESLRKAEELAKQAVAIRDNNYLSHGLLSRIYTVKRLYKQAIAEGERAVEVEPNNAMAYNMLGRTFTYAGRPEEGLVLLKKAMRLCPYPPTYYLSEIGDANYLTGRYEAALTEYKKYLKRQQHGAYARILKHWLIATYMELGREK